MYKILVVDDEQIVQNAIRYIVENRKDGLAVCGVASNGREAIIQAKALKPEIVFMDIRMPGINGIDAMKEIKHHLPETRFVIISAYEQFEFAKQAVQLGVKEYLLKPINRGKLNGILDQIVLELNQDQAQRERDLETIEKLQKMIPYIETSFIYSIISNNDRIEEMKRYFNLLEMTCESGFMMIIQVIQAEQNAVIEDLELHAHYPHIRDVIKYKCHAIVGPMMLNKIVVFVAKKKSENVYDLRLESANLGEYIQHELEQINGFECKIGISAVKNIGELFYAYGEAQKALASNDALCVTHFEDLYGEQGDRIQVIKTQNQLIEHMEKGQLNHALKCFDLLFQRICNQQERLLELVVLIYRVAYDEGVEEDAIIRYDHYLKEMIALSNTCDRQRWLINRIKYITEQISKNKSKKCSFIVERVKRALEQEYHTELSLEGVARSLNISPQYLSKLFKEETGQNFIEYLTHIRVVMAQTLMKTSHKSVKEISFEVGYSDPNYFSRLFKKQTGLMPTEFIHQVKR
ncbi:response regulator [Fusibacter sp. 3D3]|uniref:response regulator transcription factor n=1 Tax=Fusibacter sp. 3D3 TaxID=1048380 RepID=UPI000853C6E5|nr:response regulator [Fusibacter sp. 3D3]GAU79560.1 DNA-binding response regulator [Fusibacter sp. 3D3]